MAYTAPKGAPSLGFRYMKRWKVQQLKYKKGYGNLSFRSYFVPQGRVLPILWPLRGGSARNGDLFQLQVHERVASPTVEVYERVGTSVISVILSTPGGGYSLHYGLNGEAPPGRGTFF